MVPQGHSGAGGVKEAYELPPEYFLHEGTLIGTLDQYLLNIISKEE